MKINALFFLFLSFILSCSEGNKPISLKIENNFLEKLNHDQLDVLTYDLLERKSIDSLRILYEYRIAEGFNRYYYDLAASYLELKDKKGIEILKKGADYKDNNCLLALAMFYENGVFNLIKDGYKVIPNKDSSIYYYTIAANNNDLQSQYNLGMNYYNLHIKDSSDKYLKMCARNSDLDESGLQEVALKVLSR